MPALEAAAQISSCNVGCLKRKFNLNFSNCNCVDNFYNILSFQENWIKSIFWILFVIVDIIKMVYMESRWIDQN